MRSLGPVADAMRDTDDPNDPEAKARFEAALKKHKPGVSERLRNGIANAEDGLSFMSDIVEGYAEDFKGWAEEKQREVREIFEDDPAAAPEQQNTDPRSDNEPSETDRNRLVDALTKQDNPLEEILDKNPTDLTEIEVRHVMNARKDAKTDTERVKLFGIEKAFYDDKYRIAESKHDLTGKMMSPVPNRPINRNPVPARGKDGRPTAESLGALAKAVVLPLGGEAAPDVVEALQGGLNILNRARSDKLMAAKSGSVSPLFSELRNDGIAGPKTRTAFKAAARALGPAKIKEGVALGRFKRLADAPKPGGLRLTAEASFGDLFRKPSKAPGPKMTHEGLGLQATINDIGRDAFGNKFQPIKEDGDIGAKSEAAFDQVLPATGPEKITSKLGENLGFFDSDLFS